VLEVFELKNIRYPGRDVVSEDPKKLIGTPELIENENVGNTLEEVVRKLW
jgi:hypothetical protein